MDKGQSETGRLAYVLELKVVAKLMVTVNTDLDDRILSGQLGTVKHILKSKKGSVTKIYIASDDNQTTLKNMSKDVFGRQKLWVSTERAQTNIRIRSSKDTFPGINRTQFSLMVAWGCTIHKVQGVTLKKVVITFDLLSSTALRCGSFFRKNIEKKHLCHHDKNYYYFCKSNIPVINLIAGSRNMIKVSKNMSL